jgi:hypothetical protein
MNKWSETPTDENAVKKHLILEALALRVKEMEGKDVVEVDKPTRIIIAASMSIIESMAAQLGVKNPFRIKNEREKAILLAAVHLLNPEADLDEADRKTAAILGKHLSN